jgi:hypothetical protein
MRETLRNLLNRESHPDARQELRAVLVAARELVELPGNSFDWSSWEGSAEAKSELEMHIARLDAGGLPERASVSVIFAPTGPMQELSMSSGWSDVYLRLAERFDRAESQIWPTSGG